MKRDIANLSFPYSSHASYLSVPQCKQCKSSSFYHHDSITYFILFLQVIISAHAKLTYIAKKNY